MGRVVGRFYDGQGRATELLRTVEAAAAAAAEAEKEKRRQQQGGVDVDYPCNVNWSKSQGEALFARPFLRLLHTPVPPSLPSRPPGLPPTQVLLSLRRASTSPPTHLHPTSLLQGARCGAPRDATRGA